MEKCVIQETVDSWVGHRWHSASTDVWDAQRVEAVEAGERGQSSKVRRAAKRGAGGQML